MRAARISGYGARPTLEEIAVPVAGPGEMLVRVGAASLNPLDVKLQSGLMKDFFPLDFPYTLGADLAGAIEQVGPGVANWAPGDRVVARTDPTRGGALAEFALVPAALLVSLPGAVPFEDAAGLPTAGGTAWQALHEVAGLKAGQTVLVHAGAGGVGSFAIQLARAAGARVIATASGDGIEIARRLGADQVIDYRAEDFAARRSDLDLVLDTVGGDTQRRSFDVLRPGGMLVSMVSPPDEAIAKAHGVAASFLYHQSDTARLAQVVARVGTGLEVLVDRVAPLADVGAAFDRQASGRARGKIILAVRGSPG